MSSFESVPETWDDGRDGAFFRLVTGLFTAAFEAGASALLASYDDAPVARAAVLVPVPVPLRA